MVMVLGGSGTITSDKISVDANGNVGVGTSSPSSKLQVVESSTAVAGIAITNTNSGTGAAASLITSSDGGSVEWGSYSNASGLAGDGYVSINGSGKNFRIYTAGTERIRVNSSGYVTTPYQPCFHVYNNTAGGGHMNDVNGVILWNTVVFNVGGHYSTSTGRFTAPVSGKYMFNIRHLHNGANGYGAVAMYIRKNGSNYPAGQLLFHSYPAWTMASNVVLVELNASDYVDINVTDGTWHDFHNEFSGFLIG